MAKIRTIFVAPCIVILVFVQHSFASCFGVNSGASMDIEFCNTHAGYCQKLCFHFPYAKSEEAKGTMKRFAFAVGNIYSKTEDIGNDPSTVSEKQASDAVEKMFPGGSYDTSKVLAYPLTVQISGTN